MMCFVEKMLQNISFFSKNIAKIMQQEAKIYTLFKDVKCSNCGAILLFKPNTNNLVCEYCGTDNCIDIEEDEIPKYFLMEEIHPGNLYK